MVWEHMQAHEWPARVGVEQLNKDDMLQLTWMKQTSRIQSFLEEPRRLQCSKFSRDTRYVVAMAKSIVSPYGCKR